MPHTEIDTIAAQLGLPPEALEPRGRAVLKVNPARVPGHREGRVVLVSAMTPTPAGEGKTTTTIGLADALCRSGVRAVGALREPSLGPLFGHKGGAIGGGKARIIPSDSINMHFTGDLHAVTSAHNLLAAITGNHLYFGNKLGFTEGGVTWGRVLDMNDRALRRVTLEPASSKEKPRATRFDITAASEVMAVLCLARDPADLRARIDRLVVGESTAGKPVTAKDLEAGGAMAAVLAEAAQPNLVRTLEGNPVFVHGGPFANIAQGTSSLMQTLLARRVADIVLTEAGFAFDLGGFKFLDIKCRAGGFRPAAVVLVVTVRALRHHGGADFKAGPDTAAVERGLANVDAHLDAMERLGLPKPLIAINRFPDDSAAELAAVKARAKARGAQAIEGTHFASGGEGALPLAGALQELLREYRADSPGYHCPYADAGPIPEKIAKSARVVLGATGAALTDTARQSLARIERLGYGHLPICLAKTHLSISDNKDVLGRPPPFELKVTDLRLSAGAGFVVALCGPILTMPGLPERPAAAGMDVLYGPDGSYEITGMK